jgi:hypothetical protein
MVDVRRREARMLLLVLFEAFDIFYNDNGWWKFVV